MTASFFYPLVFWLGTLWKHRAVLSPYRQSKPALTSFRGTSEWNELLCTIQRTIFLHGWHDSAMLYSRITPTCLLPACSTGNTKYRHRHRVSSSCYSNDHNTKRYTVVSPRKLGRVRDLRHDRLFYPFCIPLWSRAQHFIRSKQIVGLGPWITIYDE